MSENLTISTPPLKTPRWWWASRAVMVLLGAVLILSGGLKALDLNLFVRQIQSYGLLVQPQLAALTAWAITALECFLGAALLLNYHPRQVLNLTLLLLTAFALLSLYAATQGSVEDCGCFGALFKRTPAQAAAEDGVLLILCAVARGGIRSGRSRGARLRALTTGVFTLTGVILPLFTGVPSALLTANPGQDSAIWADLKVQGLDNIDLGKGAHLVVLMSAGCQHCQAAVPEEAMLMDELRSRSLTVVGLTQDSVEDLQAVPEEALLRDGHQARSLTVVGLTQDSVEDLQAFIAEWAPPYPIGRIDGEAFWTLLEDAELPRIFLVKAGQTIRVWDQAVPSAEAVIGSLSQ